ncbi:beta-ketoacyl-ACP synthase 3 [Streptomyces rubiginosohelvolus]|uniref:beta-ketoacyl-ACP synthase 3 n=1 Tax=Streptomyces rubiginosohelvolus TaxID=67362 RepID=UPI0033AE03F3
MVTAGARISGLGGYRPARSVTNEEIAASTSLTADWITDRTGLKTRGHAGEAETIVAMAVEAGAAALRDAGVAPESVGLVVLATQTPENLIPAGAPEIATLLGCAGAGAYDLNAACAGFTYALAGAADAVRLGHVEHAVVIGSERLTDWTTPAIEDVYAMLADGAGAVVVSRAAEDGIGPPVWGSDGARRDVLAVPDGERHITMRGKLVFKWAIDCLPPAARLACERAGTTVEDLDWLVMHQANRRILDAVAKDLGIDQDRVARDIIDAGNTSAASVPLALLALRDSGVTRSGESALFLGFGAGLTYAGQVVTIP